MTGALDRSIRLVAGNRDHIPGLAKRMRRIDRIECEAMGRSPDQALYHALAASAKTWTALLGGEAQAMFGVVVESVAGSDAIPWFLGSDIVTRHGRALIKQGPAIIAEMHDHGARLRNFVSAENRRAIRLLEHWGFIIEPQLIVMRGIAFRRFKRENI